ncbi:cytochrome c oxidase subunit II [Bacillus sp. CECT 9360]|uniref:cytochrome c oxidase subunit II n=1 Tax=Bacillus sp. CECT 9360 TaxID=2845821 RepID=UPI001E460EDE|nr:cytochrome c oxidase subunit II [Bacillus sp. CECT 9360]CAH0345638.1 Cytochrome c oxidase subunit 2 [Bacillus sp. CECT 9360]
MKIHKFEKIWLLFGTGSLILFLTIVGVQAFSMGNHPPSGHHMIDPEKVKETAPFTKPGLHQTGENEYELVIVASAFNYDLGEDDKTITIPKGAKLTYKVATTDVVHGFSVAGTNVNMIVEPGYVSELAVTHEKTGKFTVVCNEYCGTGHHMMYGTIEVTDNAK